MMPLGEVVPGEGGPTGEVVLPGFRAGEVVGLVAELSAGCCVGAARPGVAGMVVPGAAVGAAWLRSIWSESAGMVRRVESVALAGRWPPGRWPGAPG